MERCIPSIEREKPAKLPFRYENEMKAFPDKQKLWEVIIPALQCKKC